MGALGVTLAAEQYDCRAQLRGGSGWELGLSVSLGVVEIWIKFRMGWVGLG